MTTRKRFLEGTTASVAASGDAPASAGPAWSPPYLPLLRRGHYDYAAMMRCIADPAPHKQMFLNNTTVVDTPGVAAIFQRMQAAWTAYEFGLQPPPARLTLAVAVTLIAKPIVFALRDAMWRKYDIGKNFQIADRYGSAATVNVSAHAWSNLDLHADPADLHSVYHDCTSPALRKRGARFLVCHNAICGVATDMAKITGIPVENVAADWTANVLPGFTVVPAGAMAVQLAQEHGWRLYPETD